MDPPALTMPPLKLTMMPTVGNEPVYQSCRERNSDGAQTRASRELLMDQLRNMIAQEDMDGYKCCDYLSLYFIQSNKQRATKKIDEGCRTSICGWMYRVADHFAIDREAQASFIEKVVSIALSFVDRVLSTNYCADRRTFKLISATSLHLAIKVHFPHMWQEVGSLLPDLSRGDFVLDDLIEMESELVHSLTWLMNPATAQGIAMSILALFPSHSSLNKVASMALFFAELSVCDYYFVTSSKLVVAVASILNASDISGSVHFQFPYRRSNGLHKHDWHSNARNLLSDLDCYVNWDEVSSARGRLWSLYRESSESISEHEIVGSPMPAKKPGHNLSPRVIQDYPSPTSCRDNRAHEFPDKYFKH
ncbi:hypothetical protein ACHAWF_006144 [Thalassiosira exigua]